MKFILGMMSVNHQRQTLMAFFLNSLCQSDKPFLTSQHPLSEFDNLFVDV